jgi:hypothetical protein
MAAQDTRTGQKKRKVGRPADQSVRCIRQGATSPSTRSSKLNSRMGEG